MSSNDFIQVFKKVSVSFPLEWKTLRFVGNLQVLKVSYLALAIVPTLASNILIDKLIGIDKQLLASTYFASLFLAFANLIYDIACPTIIKRFASSNDLYLKMLEIKKLSLKLYPNDDFRASFEHCQSAYTRSSTDKSFLRSVCCYLFFSSGILFGFIFLSRTYLLIKALLR